MLFKDSINEVGSSSQAPPQHIFPEQHQQQELPYYQFLEEHPHIMQQQQPPPYEPDDDDEDEEMPQAKAGETSSKSPVFEEEDGQMESDAGGDDDDILLVDLSNLKEDLTCIICLGILRETHIAPQCLHRFCKECIGASLRMGNNECPACRTHLDSRRALREDTIFDRLIAELYPNREDEDQELNDDDRARIKQVQASYAETYRRQREANPRRGARTGREKNHIPSDSDDDSSYHGRDTPALKSKKRGCGHRGRKKVYNTRCTSSPVDDDINSNDQDTDPLSSPTDNGRRQSNHDNNIQGDAPSPLTDLVRTPGIPRWGRGGHRRQIRRGSGTGSTRHGQGNRISGLVHHLNQLQLDRESNNEWDTCVALITLDEQSIPSLDNPYISCSPDCSIKQLHQYIAVEINVQFKEIELLLLTNPSYSSSGSVPVYDPSLGVLRLLKAGDTVEGLLSHCTTGGTLVLGYRQVHRAMRRGKY